MSAPLKADEAMKVLTLTVKVPQNLPLGIAESLEDGLTRSVQILANSTVFHDLAECADNVARLVISQVRPGGLMLEDRIGQMSTVKKVLEEGDWLTAEDINKLQKKPPVKKSLPARDWKRSGRIFSVSYGGRAYYPRYQFDVMYQPLPCISDILKAYGACADTWSLATWFHFPNGWIVEQVGNEVVPVAPKDALDRVSDVIEAACNRKGTYVA